MRAGATTAVGLRMAVLAIELNARFILVIRRVGCE